MSKLSKLQQNRINKEMLTDPSIGCLLLQNQSQANLLQILFHMPSKASMYYGLLLQLTVTITEDYPASRPNVSLVTAMPHPNCSSSGGICVTFLTDSSQWTPAISMEGIVSAIQLLLDLPNDGSPLDTSGKDIPFTIAQSKLMADLFQEYLAATRDNNTSTTKSAEVMAKLDEQVAVNTEYCLKYLMNRSAQTGYNTNVLFETYQNQFSLREIQSGLIELSDAVKTANLQSLLNCSQLRHASRYDLMMESSKLVPFNEVNLGVILDNWLCLPDLIKNMKTVEEMKKISGQGEYMRMLHTYTVETMSRNIIRGFQDARKRLDDIEKAKLAASSFDDEFAF